MPKKRMSEEQIAFALRQAESGTPVGEICRRLGVSEALVLPMEEGLCRNGRGRDPAAQTAGRRKHQAEATGGGSQPRQDDAAGCFEKKVVKPVRRREVVRHFQQAYSVSERRACHASGFGAIVTAIQIEA